MKFIFQIVDFIQILFTFVFKPDNSISWSIDKTLTRSISSYLAFNFSWSFRCSSITDIFQVEKLSCNNEFSYRGSLNLKSWQTRIMLFKSKDHFSSDNSKAFVDVSIGCCFTDVESVLLLLSTLLFVLDKHSLAWKTSPAKWTPLLLVESPGLVRICTSAFFTHFSTEYSSK